MRHCATSRKFAVSILDGVIGISSMILSFLLHYGPGVDSVSNTNEYQKYFLGGKDCRNVGLTILLHSYVDCLEMWEPQSLGTLRACPVL